MGDLIDPSIAFSRNGRRSCDYPLPRSPVQSKKAPFSAASGDAAVHFLVVRLWVIFDFLSLHSDVTNALARCILENSEIELRVLDSGHTDSGCRSGISLLPNLDCYHCYSLVFVVFDGIFCREVILEKQLTGHQVDRSICAWFWDHVIAQGDPVKLPPVIASPTHYLFQIFREGITFLACTQVEMPPLMGIEFLCRVADVLSDYLGGLNEDLIKDNFVIVYELLDEMTDNGFPLTTEPNVLREMIAPPNLVSKVLSVMTGISSNVSNTLPGATASNVPWRTTDPKHASNEVYVDLVEEIDATVNRTSQSSTYIIAPHVSSETVAGGNSGSPPVTHQPGPFAWAPTWALPWAKLLGYASWVACWTFCLLGCDLGLSSASPQAVTRL
ncbi:hypothetical protein ACLOJK_015664 [Asimina triloba]